MTLKWKKQEELESDLMKSGIDVSDLTAVDSITREDMTFRDMKRRSPRTYVVKKEKWCNGCNNAETSVRGLKKISQESPKNYCQMVLNTIRENNLQKFTTRDILEKLDPEKRLTDGSLQRKALAILVLKGYLKKEVQEIRNKKGEIIRIRFVFSLNEAITSPPCYDPLKDNHSEEWHSWRETRYFE